MSPRKMKVTDIPLVNDKNEEIKVLISAALTKLDANNKQMDDLEKKLKADVENEWSRACNYSSFPHQAHTVLWRYYHRKLQTYQCLHQICSDRRLDPYCLLCGDVEDNEHFLWSCMLKKETWSRIANRFLQPAYESLALGSSTPIQVLSGLRVERTTIVAVESLFPSLKDLDVGSLVGSELAASYIHPLIQALLSYDKDDKVSRCSNIIPDNGTDVNRRPGNEVAAFEQCQPSYRTCYGELKGEKISDTLSIMDFYRLEVFAKVNTTCTRKCT